MKEILSWQKRFSAEAEQAKKQKESEGSPDPLLFYGLQHHIIPRDDYFDWAVKHHRLPFLKPEFFLQFQPFHLPEWKKIQSMKEWSPCLAPVWFYENLVYIGCLEPPEQSFPFPFRFVLTNDQSLKMLWNNIQCRQKATSGGPNIGEPATGPGPTERAPTGCGPTGGPARPKRTSGGPARPKQASGGPNLDGPAGGPDSGGPDSREPAAYDLTIGGEDSEKTCIWRRTESNKSMASCTNLLKETKQWFSGIVIFKREGDFLKPVQCAGRINITNPDWKADLKRKSFFNIITKNQPYHGFIVKTEINKEIAESAGWPILPRHVSVIPLPRSASAGSTGGDAGEGGSVFFGVSAKPVSMSEIEYLTERVEGFFRKQASQQAAEPPKTFAPKPPAPKKKAS